MTRICHGFGHRNPTEARGRWRETVVHECTVHAVHGSCKVHGARGARFVQGVRVPKISHGASPHLQSMKADRLRCAAPVEVAVLRMVPGARENYDLGVIEAPHTVAPANG
jgi:hypothetical protein